MCALGALLFSGPVPSSLVKPSEHRTLTNSRPESTQREWGGRRQNVRVLGGHFFLLIFSPAVVFICYLASEGDFFLDISFILLYESLFSVGYLSF